jgi:hypothetical protein
MQVPSELLRDEIARLAADPAWIHEVAGDIADAIHAELIVGVDIRNETQAAAEGVIRLLIEMIGRGQPPAEAEPPAAAIAYMREFIVRRVPIESMVRAYQVGHARFFESCVASLRAHYEDPAVLADVLEAVAVWTFHYLQALLRDLIRRYADESERFVRSAASIRAETVRTLLSGGDIEATTASQRLQYSLDRNHVAFVVWAADDVDRDDALLGGLERRASDLVSALGARDVLLVQLGGHLVAGWISTSNAAFSQRSRIESPALAAFGEPGTGVEGFCRSHRQAMSARRVTRLLAARPGTVTRFNDVALMALASVDEQAAGDFVAAELGALAGDDDTTQRLAATLRAFLEEHSNLRRTAKRLGVHENTIKYRLRAVEEHRGRPAEERVAETLVALRLARLLRQRQSEARP